MTKIPGKTQTLVNKRHPEGLVYCSSQEDLLPRAIMPSHLVRGITAFVLALVLIYFLFLTYWVATSATKSSSELATSFGLWFAEYGKNSESQSLFNAIDLDYEKLMSWTYGNFWRWVLNSLIYPMVSAVIDTLISIMAGYALAKFVPPGKNTAAGAIMVGLLVPAVLLTVPFYIMFLHLGVSNTIALIIVLCCVSPFRVFLGRVYFQASVPIELIETARIDGASEVRIFFTVTLRVLAPAMVTTFLSIFVACWNNFLLPLMMLSDEILRPVTLSLCGMISYFNPGKGTVMMRTLSGVIPLITLFLGLQGYQQSGLAAGSIKE